MLRGFKLLLNRRAEAPQEPSLAFLLHSPLTLLIAQLLVIIISARLLGVMARKVHQPLVIAEIVAGILLGPSLLGLVAPTVRDALFPAASLGTLGMLSQLGLMLFMFLVGLEMDLGLLRGRGKAAVLISNAGIVAPFALGAVLAVYIHPILSDPGVPFSSFTLFMGAAMSITAFPVLARILTERRLLRSKVGALTITCAAVDDVTAWCILAFVVSIVRSTGVGHAIWTTVFAVVYILVMLLVVQRFLGRLAARGSDREGLTQNAVAVTFVLLFLSSWATELIGIHALFGAFLMGAIIPREGGFARALAEKIEDVVVIVLLPTFFALSGLRTQIGLLDSASDWLLCALIIVVACLGKFGGSALAARYTGLGWREASALGILMNTRGLMELIVLNIGLELGVISPKLFTMMVLMALFTTFITTPLLQWVYPPEELARTLSEPLHEPPVRAPEGFGVLICVAQGSSGPGLATVAGALLGVARGGDRLYGLQLLRPVERTSSLIDLAPPEDANALAPLLERGAQLGLGVRPLSFVSSAPARDICSVAEVKGVDLVLLGWHKPLLGQALLGGTVHEVLEHAPTEVAVLINRELSAIRKVLVPFHGSLHDQAAARMAARMVAATGTHVTILHFPDAATGPARARADALLRELAEAPQILVIERPAASDHDATEDVISAAIGQDLVIVGAAAEWGLAGTTFGLQRELLLQRCPTSILVVHHREAPRDRGPRIPTAPPGGGLVPPAADQA
ncbi:MAG: cation:proton antiporter [Nannocystis sp.]|nr:cation:proton antiporter [Nannocystis sp.]